MAARKKWGELSPAYKARLKRAGITYRTHHTADLTGARGHPTPPPAGSVAKDIIELLLRGEGLPEDFDKLLTQFTWPDWVPRSVSTTRSGEEEPTFVEVAAALSRLPNPRLWTSVEVIPQGEGEPWTMRVELKGNRYPREILIPGGGQEFSGARQVLGILTLLERETEEQRKKRKAQALFWEVMGTP